jgi:hypothetical protein
MAQYYMAVWLGAEEIWLYGHLEPEEILSMRKNGVNLWKINMVIQLFHTI